MSTTAEESTGRPAGRGDGGNRLSLFVFIDGFGWELAEKHRFMADVLTERRPVETIFGYSSTCDPTIITGKLPRDHGHFAFYYYQPEASPFRRYGALRWLPKAVLNRGRVRGKLSEYVKKLHGFTGYFQLYNMPFECLHLFDYSERKDIFSPGGINSGAPTIFDRFRAGGVPHVLINRPMAREETNLQALEQAIASGEPVLGYILLGRLDGLLHQYGTDAPEVAAHVAWYDQRLRELLAKAKRVYDDVRLVVFSDHGMADVTETCDLKGRIEALGLRFGEDYAAVYDSTMARFWFLEESARAPIVAALESEDRGRILSDGDLEAYGCDFPGRKYGELFFLMHPGVLICPSFMGERPLKGMHGYAPDDPDSVAALMANGPLEAPVARLDDFYEAMAAEASRNLATRSAAP